MSSVDITRRTVLIVAATLFSATTATALAITASSGASCMSDPIFVAIANHRAAAREFDAAHARLVARLPDVPEAADDAAQVALQAEIEAAKALIATAPATRSGLRALTDYLGEERQAGIAWYVSQTITAEGHTSTMHSAFGGIETLIAQREAELMV